MAYILEGKSVMLLHALVSSNSHFGINRRDKDAPDASSVHVTWNLSKGMTSLSLLWVL